MKKILLFVWLSAIFSIISYIFWLEDFRYNLPTPVPQDYHSVETGELILFGENVPVQKSRPIFFHFFNPSCPCSKFNVPHFRSLVRDYGDNIDFSIVVMHNKENYTKADLRERFGLDDIPVYFDKAIADSCGVYSTPQAALIDHEGKLFYRGNYNKSRYCTDKKTFYAKMAIDSLLSGKRNSITEVAALTSYGCSLPVCTK